MAHPHIEASGLAEKFGFSTTTDNPVLAPFLGKKVRFKRELLTPDFIVMNGTKVVDGTFLINEVQRDYKGDMRLRGYWLEIGDRFGCVINPDEVEILEA